MGKTQGIRYSHASQPIEATGAALCPYSATDYAQFCSFKEDFFNSRRTYRIPYPTQAKMQIKCAMRLAKFAKCPILVP